MFGISGTELVLILFIGFLLFGPEKLPQMGRTVGRAIRQFREASDTVNQKFKDEVYEPFKEAVDPFVDEINASGITDDVKEINKTLNDTRQMLTDPFKQTQDMVKDTFKDPLGIDKTRRQIKETLDDPMGLKKDQQEDAGSAASAEPAEQTEAPKKTKVKKGLAESLYGLDTPGVAVNAAAKPEATSAATPAAEPASTPQSAADPLATDPFAGLDGE